MDGDRVGDPAGETVNGGEDPKKKGLLFAATERAVYVSFDDGIRWQALRQNMLRFVVCDIIVKDDDLVAATHGRGFWILDDITPLRQMGPRRDEDAVLFVPHGLARPLEHEHRHAVAGRASPREPIRPTAFPSTTT